MYEYKHEEIAWQRLKDLQREMENSRRMANGIELRLTALRLLAQRVWLVAGLASRRPPRRRPVAEPEIEEAQAAPDAA